MADERRNKLVGWTDAEKIALLVNMIMDKDGPDWKKLKVPSGRTLKACTHIWDNYKRQTKALTCPSTPVSAKRKAHGGVVKNTRKKKSTKVKIEDSEEEEGEEEKYEMDADEDE